MENVKVVYSLDVKKSTSFKKLKSELENLEAVILRLKKLGVTIKTAI